MKQMDRRKFMQMLGAGTLMAMLVPSVATAFQSGNLSEDELFDLLQDGGQGLLTQEALVVGRLQATTREIPRGYGHYTVRVGNVIPVTDGEVVKTDYRITGKATERKYEVDGYEDGVLTDETHGISRQYSVVDGVVAPSTRTRVAMWSGQQETRTRKFFMGHRVRS
jgi:hypothetical protein